MDTDEQDEVIEEKDCPHPFWLRHFKPDFGLGWRTLMQVTCGKCGKWLGTIG